MSDRKAKQYNLRSGKQGRVHMPIHKQLCDDTEFLTEMLGKQSDPADTSFQDSDVSVSDSDLNCSGLLSQSDNEAHPSTTDSRTYKKFVTERQVPSISKDTSSHPPSQNLINQQILHQLTVLSERLDSIETASVKKTNDQTKIKKTRVKKSKISTHVAEPSKVVQACNSAPLDKLPDLAALRQDSFIQKQVEQRLKELTALQSGTDKKIKSQRGGVEVMVKNRIKWPHEFVLTGNTKERVSYDQLTPIQWMAGFCRTMKEEKNSEMKEHMLDYVIALLEDANDFSWGAAKASHAVLLCRMEQGEVSDFSDTLKIDRIRRANAQKHTTSNTSVLQNPSVKKFSGKMTRSMPCNYYNQDSCVHDKTHETKGVIYKHICSACFASGGKTFSHPETQCRNKSKKIQSKNE